MSVESHPTQAAALEIRNLHAWYGESHILHGMQISVATGEIVALLGRNGSGRTTTLRSIVGMVDRRSGSILVHRREAIALKPHLVARLGIGYCPEERGIFSSLSCEENLMLPPKQSEEGMSVEEIYEILPNLAERRRAQGTRLSGGEQQMLAIARILRSGARILLLDEISEGLAPVIVDRLFDLVTRLKERGYTTLLVEQNKYFAEPLADRFLVVERGQVVMQLTRDELSGKADAVDRILGI
ncbi:ABC transporter ATP-binding protein [Bradyrhizobium sp. PRIMUS42]|uniref:ABC transporter ATP-binding protein n=1 Tax=Bradyrhizobium sp. PRIMUS42 TaxID=2908926 RepID=UPI0028681C40|nr:ABC transporter ATP-binding protein [Bradyrhizobium sp. PRIMUS42]